MGHFLVVNQFRYNKVPLLANPLLSHFDGLFFLSLCGDPDLILVPGSGLVLNSLVQNYHAIDHLGVKVHAEITRGHYVISE